MMFRLTVLLAAAAVLSVCVRQASATTIVYSEDFEGAVGPEWTASNVSTTPVGSRSFLGRFVDDTVQLNLSELPVHAELAVSFDLFVIHSWDGNYDAIPEHGPDRWALSILDGPTLLDTTFSNDHPTSRPWGQAFPDDSPGGPYPAFTGAAETNSLGYEYWLDPTPTDPTGYVPMDSVYHLEYTFPHNADSLSLNFSGSNLRNMDDESWGLDNVTISLTAIPEPSTFVLLTMGAVGLLAYTRRRKR